MTYLFLHNILWQSLISQSYVSDGKDEFVVSQHHSEVLFLLIDINQNT